MPDFVEPPVATRTSTPRPSQIFERTHSEEWTAHHSYRSSWMHRSSVDVKNSWRATYIVRSVPSKEQVSFLKDCPDRAATLMYTIIHDLAAVSNDLDAAPPIQSRMYQ